MQHVGAVRYLLYRQQLALRKADEVGLRLGGLQMHTPPYYPEYLEYPASPRVRSLVFAHANSALARLNG